MGRLSPRALPRPAPRPAAAMAARRVPALAGAALGRQLPAAPPPRPVWVGPGFRRPVSVTLCSASEGDRGGSGPRLRDRPEGAARRPAREELTPTDRRIADLHAAACSVRPRPTPAPRGPCACAVRPLRPAQPWRPKGPCACAVRTLLPDPRGSGVSAPARPGSWRGAGAVLPGFWLLMARALPAATASFENWPVSYSGLRVDVCLS